MPAKRAKEDSIMRADEASEEPVKTPSAANYLGGRIMTGGKRQTWEASRPCQVGNYASSVTWASHKGHNNMKVNCPKSPCWQIRDIRGSWVSKGRRLSVNVGKQCEWFWWHLWQSADVYGRVMSASDVCSMVTTPELGKGWERENIYYRKKTRHIYHIEKTRFTFAIEKKEIYIYYKKRDLHLL